MRRKLTFTLLKNVDRPAVKRWVNRWIWVNEMEPHTQGGKMLPGTVGRWTPVLWGNEERLRRGFPVADFDLLDYDESEDVLNRAKELGCRLFVAVMALDDFLYYTGSPEQPDDFLFINVLVAERQKDVVSLKMIL